MLSLIRLMDARISVDYIEDIMNKLINSNCFFKDPCRRPYPLIQNRDYIYASFLLEYVPIKNLRKILIDIDNIISSMTERGTIKDVIRQMAKLDYLSFDPYVTTHADTPILVLAYNKYVRLNKEHYYEVTSYDSGAGPYRTASILLLPITNIFKENNSKESNLLKYLYYMNFIEACTGIKPFDELIKNNSELLDEFMRLATIQVFDNYNITYNQMKKELSHNQIKLQEEQQLLNIYRIAADDINDYAQLKVYGTTCVGVVKLVNDVLTETLFEFPAYLLQRNTAHTSNKPNCNINIDEFLITLLNISLDIAKALKIFALNTSGIVVDDLRVAPIHKEITSTFLSLNTSTAFKLQTLDDL